MQESKLETKKCCRLACFVKLEKIQGYLRYSSLMNIRLESIFKAASMYALMLMCDLTCLIHF